MRLTTEEARWVVRLAVAYCTATWEARLEAACCTADPGPWGTVSQSDTLLGQLWVTTRNAISHYYGLCCQVARSFLHAPLLLVLLTAEFTMHISQSN